MNTKTCSISSRKAFRFCLRPVRLTAMMNKSTLCFAIERIVFLRTLEQVRWVHARGVVAVMKSTLNAHERAIVHLVGDAVGSPDRPITKPDGAVATTIARASPLPACTKLFANDAAVLVDLLPKPNL